MKLPIAFTHGEGLFVDATVIRPRGGVLADSRKAAEQGDFYGSILTFVAGIIERLTDSRGGETDDRAAVRMIVKDSMPFEDANYLAIQSLIMTEAGDEIDGVYPCPRCNEKVYPSEDSPDLISELEVRYADNDGALTFSRELKAEVEVREAGSGASLDVISSINLRVATIGDCMKAARSVGQKDVTRLNYAIMASCIIKVNGNEVDDKWRKTWGEWLFERMDSLDIREITRETSRYGYVTSVQRRCPHCDKEWQAEVNTAGFFGSALQGTR